MEESFKNIKRVYKYGKDNKKHLFWMIFACISGSIMGLIVPLFSAKQIIYITSNIWEQAIYTSIVILLVKCYMAFGKCFLWSRQAHRFVKGTTKNIQIVLRKRDFKN